MPQVQDRILTDDEVLLAQSRETDGAVVYTSMNDRGEFFTGATKVNGTTGEETTIGAPQVTSVMKVRVKFLVLQTVSLTI